VSPVDIVALLRRHLMAVGVIFILTLGLGYRFTHTPQGYVDTATVVFAAPQGALFSGVSDLLVIDALTTNSMMSETGHLQVNRYGGTSSYNVTLVNLNTEDYPNYSNPYVSVTTSSQDAATAQRTFSAVMKVLQDDLAELQARQGAKPYTWIQARTIATPSGPVAQTGSRKRTLLGLAILATIATFMMTKFLDRHPIQLTSLLRRGNGLDTRPGTWSAEHGRPAAD
jgi:hypothetical protein